MINNTDCKREENLFTLQVGPSWFAEDAKESETKRRANYVFYLKTAGMKQI